MTSPRFVVDVGARRVLRASERDERISSIEGALQSGGGSPELTNIVAQMREAAREAESRGRARLASAREEVRAEGYPEQDDDVEYLLEDATGLGRGVYTALKGALLDRLRVVREVAGVCWAEMDKMITDHSRLRPMAISDVEAQRRFVIGRFLKARQDIINKYQSYLRNLKWLQLASSRQRRGCLTPKQNNILRVWLFSNFQNPYPEPVEKADLARRTDLTATQINNWFINARVRVWKPTVELMTGERMRRETPAPPSPPRGSADSGPGVDNRPLSVAGGMKNQHVQLSRRRNSLPAIPGLANSDQAHAGGALANGPNSFHRQMDPSATMLGGSHRGHLPPQPIYNIPPPSQYQSQQNRNPNVSNLKSTSPWSGAQPGPLISNAGEAALPRLPGSSPSNLPAIGGRSGSGRIEKPGALKKRGSTARDVSTGRPTGLPRGGIGANYEARAMGDRPSTGLDYAYQQPNQNQPVSHHGGLYQSYNPSVHPPTPQVPVDPYARNRFQDQYQTQQNQQYAPYGKYMREHGASQVGAVAGGGNSSLMPPPDQMHRIEAGAQYHQQYHQPTHHQSQPMQQHQHQSLDQPRGYEFMPPHHQGQASAHPSASEGYPIHSANGETAGADHRSFRPPPAGNRVVQPSHTEHPSYGQQHPFSQMIHQPAGQEEGYAPQAWGSAPGPPGPWPNSLDQFPAPTGGP